MRSFETDVRVCVCVYIIYYILYIDIYKIAVPQHCSRLPCFIKRYILFERQRLVLAHTEYR